MTRLLLFLPLASLLVAATCSDDLSARTQALQRHNTGVALAQETKYAEAIAEYDAAVALAPEEPLIYHSRGVAYLLSANYGAAITDFNKALQLDPDRGNTYYERGLAYYQLADFEKALTDLAYAMQLTSDPDTSIPAQKLLDEIRAR